MIFDRDVIVIIGKTGTQLREELLRYQTNRAINMTLLVKKFIMLNKKQ